MSHASPNGRLLRVLSLPLIVGGVAVHLWTGTKIGLAAAAVGLAAHVVAALLGRRWIRRRRALASANDPAAPAPRT